MAHKPKVDPFGLEHWLVPGLVGWAIGGGLEDIFGGGQAAPQAEPEPGDERWPGFEEVTGGPNPFESDELVPIEFEYTPFLTDEEIARIGESRGLTRDFYEGRMDDDFSVMTPEQSAAAMGSTGSISGLADQGAAHFAASRGISPASGVSQQQRNYGASAQATAYGDMLARVHGYDEEGRRWAAGQLEGMTGFDIRTALGQENIQAGLAIGQFGALAGEPELSYADPIAWKTAMDWINRLSAADRQALIDQIPDIGDIFAMGSAIPDWLTSGGRAALNRAMKSWGLPVIFR